MQDDHRLVSATVQILATFNKTPCSWRQSNLEQAELEDQHAIQNLKNDLDAAQPPHWATRVDDHKMQINRTARQAAIDNFGIAGPSQLNNMISA